MDYSTQTIYVIAEVIFIVLLFYFLYGVLTRQKSNPLAAKKFMLAAFILVFLLVLFGSIPVLVANLRTNPLLLFGSIGLGPVIIGYIVWKQIKSIRRISRTERSIDQSGQVGATTFYSSKENPNVHASFTNKNPGNVTMHTKIIINGETLSEE